jgi:hypothetical protein
MKSLRCHDCGVKEGQLHRRHISGDICDMESCPVCGGQRLSCGCSLKGKKRIPYIVWPWVCARCGEVWPEEFYVPDEEWKRYIEPGRRSVILCEPCFREIKHLIDTHGGKSS